MEAEPVEPETEMELCRFTLKTGAVLRRKYQGFADFYTAHNTINILHVPYAGIRQDTLSPEITTYFARELFGNNHMGEYDISFGMLCLQGDVVQREVILTYLKKRLDAKEDLENEEIHACLLKILGLDENGEREEIGKSR